MKKTNFKEILFLFFIRQYKLDFYLKENLFYNII